MLTPFSQNGTAVDITPPDPTEYSVNTDDENTVPLATDRPPQPSTSMAIDTKRDNTPSAVSKGSNRVAWDRPATPGLPSMYTPSQRPVVGSPSTNNVQTIQDQAAQDEFQAKALERAIKRQANQIQTAQQQADQEDARQKAFYENSARLQPPHYQTGEQGATHIDHTKQPLATQEQGLQIEITKTQAQLAEMQIKIQAVKNQKNIEIAEIQAKLVELQDKVQALENQKNNEKRTDNQQEEQPLSHSSPDEHGNSIQGIPDDGQKPESTLDKAQP